ncbi:hypothetical protein TNCV_2879601 [Trichonephila clavipes]|uniref:Uncharacterized protein n=1 Tax=Trichonephila clavipes TaxID=2585209 RepID=A0A8X6W1M4_TRICX|nr:hypothetical protein TNCV_2879601 [Trichonephila clavipes]
MQKTHLSRRLRYCLIQPLRAREEENNNKNAQFTFIWYEGHLRSYRLLLKKEEKGPPFLARRQGRSEDFKFSASRKSSPEAGGTGRVVRDHMDPLWMFSLKFAVKRSKRNRVVACIGMEAAQERLA